MLRQILVVCCLQLVNDNALRDKDGLFGVVPSAVHLGDVDLCVHIGQLPCQPLPDSHEPSLYHLGPAPHPHHHD